MPTIFISFLLTLLTAQGFTQINKPIQLDSLMTSLYERGQFNGAIIVADHHKLLYKKSFGLANREKRQPFTMETQEYIGSLSKQFTAMGILMLKEKEKLNFNQSIRHFFPQLPQHMDSITVAHLLYHTSGLALFDDYPDMTEKDVFDILLKQDRLRFTPGEKFEYCNAGYSLLGLIIQKVSGQSLNAFMQKNIFRPLGMNHTEVHEPSHKNTRRAVGYTLFGTINNYDTYMGGNACIISTAEDLYKWNQALYNFPLVSHQAMEEYFKSSFQITNNPALQLNDPFFGEKSYGLGWWITHTNNSTGMFHDGAFSGYISYIERMPERGLSIIALCNLRHPFIYDTRKAIIAILNGQAYTLPKIPGSVWLQREATATSMSVAIDRYKKLFASDTMTYDFNENVLNSYAYILLRSGQVQQAITVFRLNADLYPNSFNVYDSMADGYEKAGDIEQALASRRKALQIQPDNDYEKERIIELERKKESGR